VHRIGRTGRAGAEGAAVSLVSHEDRPLLAAIERLMNRKVEMRVVAGFEPGQHQPRPQAEPQRPQRHQQRQGQGQRPPQRQPQRHAKGPQTKHPQRPTHGQQQKYGQPSKHRPLRPHPADRLTREQEAQLQEAYARVAAEGATQE